MNMLYPGIPFPPGDEDGVTFVSSLSPGGTVTVTVVASVAGALDAWIDFGQDSSWAEAGDQIFTSVALSPGSNNLSFTVPASAVEGTTYARFRFSTAGGLPYDGPAPDGEVEDYPVEIILLKWSQPPQFNPASQNPECFWGWDEISIYDSGSAALWFPCWANPRQCHGDADGLMEGTPFTGFYYVGTNDLLILGAAMGTVFPNPGYNPCADFDRDGDVDLADQAILTVWWQVKDPPNGPGVPADCATAAPVSFPIVADDWYCDDLRPVTDVHWWGSYESWLDIDGPGDVIGFHIGIWTDVPADAGNPFSHPKDMVWEWWPTMADLTEEYVGCDFHPDFMAFPDSCFKYDFQIPQEQWFYQGPGCSNIYWISISAIYDPAATLNNPWGWKTREHYYNDDAVRIFDPIAPVVGSMYNFGEPIEDLSGDSWDMAFELSTEECYAGMPDYSEWVAAGKPPCWCYPTQCEGDADGKTEGGGILGTFHVGTIDIGVVAGAWKVTEPTKGPGITTVNIGGIPGACGDFDHATEGGGILGTFRVGSIDIGILAVNWKVTEPTKGPGIAKTCVPGNLMPPPAP
jgi:hypothetical protein